MCSMTLLTISALFLSPNLSFAQTDTWASDSDGNWFTDTNWIDGTKPTSTDDVVINASGNDYRVDLSNNASFEDLAISSSNATLWTHSGGGYITLAASGGIEIFSGELQTSGPVLFNTANGIVNHAGLFQAFGQGTVADVRNGFINEAAGEVKIRGSRNSQGSATFGAELMAWGMNNLGTVKLETTTALSGGVFAKLNVVGTLNNSGLIDSRPFEGGGAGGRSIMADTLINSGTIVNNDIGGSSLELNHSQGNYTNTGDINAAAGDINFQNVNSLDNQSTGKLFGTSMKIDGYSNTVATATNAGSISLSGNLQLVDLNEFDNSGDIHVGGDFSFPYRTFHHRNGATLTGGNNLSMTNATLDLENGFTTDFTTVNLSGTTIQGAGTYASQAGTTTYIIGATVQSGVSWENSGFVSLQGSNTISAAINGGFTNTNTGELRIRGYRYPSGYISAGATLNVAGGVNNAGIIGFETSRTSPGTWARLDIAGTLDNSGLIESRPFEGSATSSRRIQADVVVNSGTIRQNDTGNFDFNKSNATYSNSGLIQANFGKIQFQNIGGFTNSGEINIAEFAEVGLTGNLFINDANGKISGEGTLNSTVTTFTDNGTLSPGASPGLLTMQVNNYIQSSSGLLDMEIAGLLAGTEYDQVVFSGNSAQLNGTLRLTFSGGFAPTVGDEFDLLFGPLTTNFSAIEVFGLQPGFQYDAITSGGSFTLAALNSATAVPEPSSALLFCLASCGIVIRGRRHRRFVSKRSIRAQHAEN